MSDAARTTSLVADEATRSRLLEQATSWPSATLDDDQRSELELLLGGALAPRRGWTAAAPLHVRITGTTETGSAQTDLTAAGHVVLRDTEGVALAVLDVDDAGPAGDALVGDVRGLALPDHHDLPELRRPAFDVAHGLAPLGRVLGVVVSRPLHLPDVDRIREAAGDGHVLLLLAAVETLDRFALARAVQPAVAELGRARTTVVLAPESDWLAEHLAGPEAEDHLLTRYGATSHLRRAELDADHHEALVRTVTSRTDVDTTTWPAVVRELRQAHRPPRERGLVLFFTGLSGSGKSTIAQLVTARLRESGERQVTLLDGDDVRTHLSAGLGFSPEDRDRNVRRIGWVAAEIARHGGTAVASPIAPYDDARRANRRAAHRHGAGFVLVHVATPLEVCEQRDRKGLYAKARAGLITGFTGIDAPYEAPSDAEITVDTTDLSAAEARDRVLDHLVAAGWIRGAVGE